MNVFIAVCEDRHYGLTISVHRTRGGANIAIDAFKATYERYLWTEDDCGRDVGWLRCTHSNSPEGPSARIEVGKLEN